MSWIKQLLSNCSTTLLRKNNFEDEVDWVAKLSIIITAYNVENYINECIESILMQNYQNFELIIINDASTDRTGEFIEAFQRKDPRIIYINKTQNEGVAASRNDGLAIATGEYISFVDGDDIIDKNAYKILLEYSVKSDGDVVCGEFTSDKKMLYSEMVKENVIAKSYTGKEVLQNLFNGCYPPEKETGIISVWGKIYKRNIFTELRFIEKHCFEDHYVTCMILNNAKKIIEVNANIYYYRTRQGSIINSLDFKKHLDKQYIWAAIANVFDKSGSEFAANAGKFYFQICLDIIKLVYENRWYEDKMKHDKFRIAFWKNKNIFWKYIKWHQKIVFLLLMLNNKRINKWIVTQNFAPGQKILRKKI